MRVANAWIIFALLFGLMLTGMPISISLGLTVLTYLFTMTTVPIESVALKLFTGIEKFEIMAIPFFILAGNFLTHGGVARRMINFASSMVGHWHGGLGLAGVMACALFAAVSGSSPATVVAIGSIILPAMVKQGFPARFGAGVITTSGALGILIPPSIVMVMYAVATNTSVGAAVHRRHHSRPRARDACSASRPGGARARTTTRASRRRRWARALRAFRESVWGLLLIVVVIGGIYTGIFTPTEAAAMSAVYAFFVAVFVYKDMPLSKVPKVLLDSANMSAMLLYIITNAVMFSYLMTSEQIPQELAAWMLDKGLGVVAFLLVRQRAAAARRQRDGAVVDRADHGADPVPGRDEARHRPGALRHHDGGQHGSRHVPPAGGTQPLRRVGHHQDGHHRAHDRRVAVAADDARVPVLVTYWPALSIWLPQDARHDVTPLRRPRRRRPGAAALSAAGASRRRRAPSSRWRRPIESPYRRPTKVRPTGPRAVRGRAVPRVVVAWYNFEFTRFYRVGAVGNGR